MAFNANNFIIDRVRRVTEFDLETGMVNWTITSIENPTVEFTGETTDKNDAYGVLLARFDSSKGVTFSGEGSLLSAPMLASQLGTDVQVASEGTKVTGKTFEILTVTDGTATMTHEPSTPPAYVYTISQDKNIDSYIEVGAEPENASVSGATITLPESFEGTQVGVMYDFETDSAIKVVDGSENYADAAGYIVDILAADVCNSATKRAGSLVFPKARIDNNVSITLTTEGTHPFSFSALKDYCSDEAELCYLLFTE